jgi:hypothetical protein
VLQLNWDFSFYRTVLNRTSTLYLDLVVTKIHSSIIILGAPTETAHDLAAMFDCAYGADCFANRDSNNTNFNFNPSIGDEANGNIA